MKYFFFLGGGKIVLQEITLSAHRAVDINIMGSGLKVTNTKIFSSDDVSIQE